jgi:hypothetical protein
MGQTNVRCITYENLLHLTNVPFNPRDNVNFSIMEIQCNKKIQNSMTAPHLILSPRLRISTLTKNDVLLKAQNSDRGDFWA